MGDELVNSRAPRKTYTEVFYEAFPYYLSIGMTYAQFWEMDATLVRYYRQADALRLERKNLELWLQGRYVYDAVCCASPLLQAFAQKGTKALPYTKEPYPLTGSPEKKRAVQEKKDKAVMEKGLSFMNAFVKAQTVRRETEAVSGDGRRAGNTDTG